MKSGIAIVVISILLAVVGLVYERFSSGERRAIRPDDNKRPPFIHRNLNYLGKFNAQGGIISYHCFCLGPLLLFPIGCYLRTDDGNMNMGGQKWSFMEILALYFRWGWIVALITLCTIIFA